MVQKFRYSVLYKSQKLHLANFGSILLLVVLYICQSLRSELQLFETLS